MKCHGSSLLVLLCLIRDSIRKYIYIWVYYKSIAYELRNRFGTWQRDAPIDFAVAAPWTNLPQGSVLGIVLGWAGFAAMATS